MHNQYDDECKSLSAILFKVFYPQILRKNQKVKELMTLSVITVTENSTLMECVDHMLKNNVKRVPVLDKENKVSGMLYERDVFYEITKVMLGENAGG